VTTRRIICTVPAPLLLANTPRFTPELPLDKQAALLELPLQPRLCNSVLLPADALALDVPAWERIGEATTMTLSRVGDDGDWLADVRYRGPRAEALRGQDEELLKALVLRDLGEGLGQSLAGVAPLWSQSVDWQAENFSLGAITRPADPRVHQSMAAPLGDTLFFAGEAAATPAFAGTVHGAYESGVRAGEQAARSLLSAAEDAAGEPA
jgi:hypothetical protein